MTTDADPSRRRRLTRDEKKAMTRRQLLDAATTVFLHRGFFATSLEEVAEEAGFSKGAVYSNFRDKEDLLLALVEERVEARARRVVQRVDADAPRDAQAREAGLEYAHIVEEEREWMPLFLEFWACAARNPDLQRRFAIRYRAMKATSAGLIEERAARRGRRLSMPAEEIATMLFAMGVGFSLERLSDPDGVRDELFGTMLASFLAGIEARNDRRTRGRQVN